MYAYYNNIIKAGTEDREMFFGTYKGIISTTNNRGVKFRVEILDVYNSKFEFVTKSVVFDYTKAFINARLAPGDRIRFYARKIDYIDKLYNRRYSRLFYPNKISILVNPVKRIDNNSEKKVNTKIRINIKK